MSKPISIVITTHDDSTALRESLPEFFSQQYDATFEVIVVRETRQGPLRDLLEPLIERYPNLHTTYLPDKPQYVTDEEIQILLGVKAAKYEEIVIVSPHFMPSNDNWLKETADIISDSVSGLSSERPMLLGDEHYSDLGFFRRLSHRKRVRKCMKPWLKQNDIHRKSLYLSKEDRCMFSIAFTRQSYLDDMKLRNIIYVHTDI